MDDLPFEGSLNYNVKFYINSILSLQITKYEDRNSFTAFGK